MRHLCGFVPTPGCIPQPWHHRDYREPGGFGQQDVLAPSAISAGELATTMMTRGAAGTLIGAAVAPPGKEGVWGAVGFVMGATLGEIGIVGVALAALWGKAR